jgi:ATP-binding cassette subfamily C protein
VWNQELEQILVILVLFLRLTQSLAQVQQQYKALVNCEAPFTHLQALIQAAEAMQERRGGNKTASLNRDLRVENVHFSYEGQPVLSGADLIVPAYTLVCLSGPSGSGKTTLIDLVCGLVRPQGGEVLIDGVQMGEIDLCAWRRLIGYVPQELILFHDTLLSNVTLGDPQISDEQVEAALRAAEAWEFVEKLPEGIHTVVGERGMRFSGGQRQRISIARALVRNPQLLILDEVTASLDPAAEQAVCRTLAGLRGRVTMLAATHQLSLTRVADAVYRIEDGLVKHVKSADGDAIATLNP